MPREKAPANETPAQRFIRIANGRHSRIADGIDGLGKLVGSAYESNSTQHQKLFADLRMRIDRAEKALASNKPSSRAAGGLL